MEPDRMARFAKRIQDKRAGKGIRDTAKEVGVSPATLSRVENGRVPDLDTFGKICRWLGEDASTYLGTRSSDSSGEAPKVRVHFKKGAAIKPESAKALTEMILLAHKALMEEEFED
jgi:transcriptional regulator with XRE-family HTH domain